MPIAPVPERCTQVLRPGARVVHPCSMTWCPCGVVLPRTPVPECKTSTRPHRTTSHVPFPPAHCGVSLVPLRRPVCSSTIISGTPHPCSSPPGGSWGGGRRLPQKSTASRALEKNFPLVTRRLSWNGQARVLAHLVTVPPGVGRTVARSGATVHGAVGGTLWPDAIQLNPCPMPYDAPYHAPPTTAPRGPQVYWLTIPDGSPEDCDATVEADWLFDSKGRDHLDFALWFDALFHFADIWCPSNKETDYVGLLSKIFLDMKEAFRILRRIQVQVEEALLNSREKDRMALAVQQQMVNKARAAADNAATDPEVTVADLLREEAVPDLEPGPDRDRVGSHPGGQREGGGAGTCFNFHSEGGGGDPSPLDPPPSPPRSSKSLAGGWADQP